MKLIDVSDEGGNGYRERRVLDPAQVVAMEVVTLSKNTAAPFCGPSDKKYYSRLSIWMTIGNTQMQWNLMYEPQDGAEKMARKIERARGAGRRK